MPGQRGLLATLGGLPRTAVFLGALAIGLAGLFLPAPVGPLILLAVAVALAALLARTWAATPAVPRTVRLLILAGLALIALLRLFG